MIITRIRRGASRTNLLVKRNLSALTSRSTVSWVRTSRPRIVAVALLAVRVATFPVPVAKAASLAVASGDAEVPPSTIAVVSFQPTTADSLQIPAVALQPIQVGQSNQALQEAAAAQAAVVAAAAEQARIVAARQAAVTTAVVAQPSDPALYNEIYQRAVADLGVQEADAMMYIAERESGVRLDAVNSRSGACGIWQALPCSKMGGMDLDHQYNWVKAYAFYRYGSFVNAEAYWKAHGNW